MDKTELLIPLLNREHETIGIMIQLKRFITECC